MPKSGNKGRPSNRTKKTTGKSKPTKLRKNADGSQSYVRGNTQKDKYNTAREVDRQVVKRLGTGIDIEKALGPSLREVSQRHRDRLGMAKAQGTASANAYLKSLKKKKK